MLQQLCVNTPSASLVGDVQEMEWQEMKKSKQIWQRLVVYKRTPRQCGHLIIAQQLRSQLALGAHSSQYPEVRAVVFFGAKYGARREKSVSDSTLNHRLI